MTERQQAIVCAFDQCSPRVSEFDIHELVYETLHLQEHEVVMIQIDGPRRHVDMKFRDPQRMQAILTATQGQEDFRHDKRRNLKTSNRGGRIRKATSEGGQLTPRSGRQDLENGAGCIW